MPTTQAVPNVKPARFVRGAPLVLAVTASEIANNLATGQRQLLDARSPDRYRGENETLDPVAGHIPGAVSRFFKWNLDADGSFKAPSALRKDLDAVIGAREPADVIHYCGSGVTACHNLLAMEIAGLGGSRLYPGSWSE